MAAKRILLFAVALLLVSSAAFSDWDISQPAKWVQFPDLDTTGIDVRASWELILADDFECIETGPITSIHIWGSWLSDHLPMGSPDSVRFILSIHADIPDTASSTGYSMPGDVLWYREFGPGEFSSRVWAADIEEGWMYPPDYYIFPADWTCWQYNFPLPASEQFEQQGTPDDPIVYWLDLKALPFVSDAYFGWKTSLDHWNDDAVWGEGDEPYLGPWYDLWYIPPHPWTGQSIDLAFVIVGEEDPDIGKWIQRPDLSTLGIDIDATDPFILADDFLCKEPGRITEIDVWGSWQNDDLPYDSVATAVDFVLSFHEDIPVGPSGYSIPGDVLWHRTFVPGEFTAEIWRDGIREGFMSPPDYYIFPGDTVCWLYRFYIDPYEAFFQSGTVDSGIVYWLDVQAYPHDIDTFFGWKTSYEHWNDDAVWGWGSEPYLGPWYELRYPPGHELEGQSIDLAFRLYNDAQSGVPSEKTLPERFGLHQNTPNPFSAATTIRYDLPANGHVRLMIYDVTGRVVKTLVDEMQTGGMQTAAWSGRNDAGRPMPAGIYFYRLTSGKRQATQKMLYLK